MKKIEVSRKLKVTIVAAILLVVVPIGLLGVFMPMRVELEPIMVESVSWRMERPRLDPDHSLPINESVHNANTTDEASVGVGVHLLYYKEDWDEAPFAPNRDGVTFRVAVTANTRKGITYYCNSPYTYPSNEWIEAVDPVPGVTGDNSGAWLNISLYYGARFYGGPGYECRSAEYTKVWVCTNGFLSFDSEFTGPPNIKIVGFIFQIEGYNPELKP